MSDYRENKIKSIINLYYSRPDIQRAIYEFSKNREICPRYFEGFGKRPDSFQYPRDIFEMVKKGATSFNCSEELWENPMKIFVGMTEEQAGNLRIGWDLIIDIDCKYFDFSKKAAESIIKVFKNHGIKNIGIKFSGSKGFHIILPWKAFPDKISEEKTKNLFPDLPRKIISYIRFQAEKEMRKIISDEELGRFRETDIKRGIKCNNCREIISEYRLVNYFCPKCRREELKKIFQEEKKEYKCPECRTFFEIKDSKNIAECRKCRLDSEKNPKNFSKEIEIDLFDLMGLDLVMVSPRHLFRMPYSLHEKTALASIVLDSSGISKFDLKDADPLKAEVKNFMPDSIKGEAEKLTREALDWAKENQANSKVYDEKIHEKYRDFKPVILKNIQDSNFPPCVKKILEGVKDGKKRALFILTNLFRSVGMDKAELEKRLYEWNKKNTPPLREGYIKAQLSWSYRRKPILPPNFDNDYYKCFGIIPTQEELNHKNPVSYIIKKTAYLKK